MAHAAKLVATSKQAASFNLVYSETINQRNLRIMKKRLPAL